MERYYRVVSFIVIVVSLYSTTIFSSAQIDLYAPETCQQLGVAGGFLCTDNCTVVKRCAKLSNTWLEITVDRCSSGLHCDANAGTCTAQTTACTVGGNNEFQCTIFGIYPHPYDCQKFYVCDNNLQAIELQCTGDTAYDSVHNDCSKSVSDPVCNQGPYFQCTDTVNRGLWEENMNIYYYCSNSGLSITMVRCDKWDEIWNSSGGSCTASNFTSNGTVTTTTTSTTRPPFTFTCTRTGTYQDPADCRKYYLCIGHPLTAYNYTCPSAFYFNGTRGTCLRGNCPNTIFEIQVLQE